MSQSPAQDDQNAEVPAPALKSSSEDIIIEFKDVHKSFGPHHILKGISFEVPRGQVLGLMGGSGTGKSVTLRHVIGLLTQDSGTVEVEGRNVADLSKDELAELRKRMGYAWKT